MTNREILKQFISPAGIQLAITLILLVCTCIALYVAASLRPVSDKLDNITQTAKANEQKNIIEHAGFVTKDMFSQYEKEVKDNLVELKNQVNQNHADEMRQFYYLDSKIGK